MTENSKDEELSFWETWCSGRYPWLGGFEHHSKKWVNSMENFDPYSCEGRDLTLNEFSEKNKYKFLELTNHSGPIVEVGGGMSGQSMFWWWREKPIQIDPLWTEYERIGKDWSKKTGLPSWLENHQSFKKITKDLYGKFGIVVCRNCIDHDPDPEKFLEEVLNLGDKGSLLLFWTELTHSKISPGHYNSKLSPSEVKCIIEKKGFKILWEVKAKHGPGYIPGDEFGCTSIKN